MPTNLRPVSILIADDDPEDRMMIKDALMENRMANNLKFVENGEEVMDYLRHQGAYRDGKDAPRPGIILLDLNMPKKDGREVLRELKSDPQLKDIPVIVLTTSKSDEDIVRSYDLGVNSFISKPVTFEALVAITGDLGRYWFGIVELPKDRVKND